MRRWLARIAIGLVALATIVIGAAYFYLWTGLPTTSGTMRLAGPRAAIEIIRDPHGVPHIFAADEDDASFALGFVHAQDRLGQMELMRLVARGQLAAVVGRGALDLDRFMRLTDASGAARRSFQAISAPARARLAAYAAGVNAYLDTHRGAWPLEFILMRHAPSRWQPEDSLLWAQLMQAQLAANWREELARWRVAGRLSPAERAELWPDWPTDAGTTYAGLFDIERLLARLPDLGPHQASNIWLVAGSRSATGRPFLVNDPHLALTAPGVWYLARVVTPTRSWAGATAPGVPGFIFGRNDRIAWGFTTTNADTTDLFIERIDPADATRYLTESGSEPFVVRRETIAVSGEAPVEMTVRATRNGVVISDLAEGAPAGHVIALAWPGFVTPDRTPDAIFALQNAGDWNQFLAAIAEYQAPVQNIGYADRDGHIAMISPGLLPRRGAGDGSAPVEGWVAANRWQGFQPAAMSPRSLDPSSGRLVNANNRVVPADYPIFVSNAWDAPYRAERIAELIDARPLHDRAGMETIQRDAVSRFARAILPLIGGIEGEGRAAEAIALLSGWNGDMRRERPEPLIFNAWMQSLTDALLRPRGIDPNRERPAVLRAALAGTSVFCAPNCPRAVRDALNQALGELTARYGADMTRWRWGQAHAAPFAHAVFSRVPVLRDLVGFRVAADGDYYTINRGGMRGGPTDPFADTHGAGYRAIYDLADLERSQFVMTPGQSGHPLSRHWGDLAQDWADGRLFTLTGSRDDLARTGAVLRLVP